MLNRKLRMRAIQQGIGLPAAIFIITTMAAIAVAINSLVQENADTFAEEVNLARAFYAAESGAGFMMNRIFPPEAYSGYAGSNCAARTYTFDAIGLAQCTAVVSCSTITVSSTDYNTIESTGSCGDVERTIQVRVVK
ncbi:MAG: MSHA biogenesis protein MshP [Pseudohongiellaceae bacterium]|jgi:MSHA biogenesis protein MshP